MSVDFLETLQQLRDGTYDHAALRRLNARTKAQGKMRGEWSDELKRFDAAIRGRTVAQRPHRSAQQDTRDRKTFDAYVRGQELETATRHERVTKQFASDLAASGRQVAMGDAKALVQWIRTGRGGLRPGEAEAQQMEHKAVAALDAVQTTAVQGNTATISGYLACFNNIDQGGDVILPSAFSASLQALRAQQQQTGSPYLFPLLYGHDQNRPIGGVISAEEDGFGLYITALIDLDTSDGRDAYNGITKSYSKGLSIGYLTKQQHYRRDGVRELVQVDLFEGSVVALAMNPLASVTSSKLN